MKKLFFIGLVSFSLFSCARNGYVNIDENLPKELKGLKVYTVSIDGGMEFVRVAVLNNQINSVTYPRGKTQETVIMVNQNNQPKLIRCEHIISENDSIVVCRKSKLNILE